MKNPFISRVEIKNFRNFKHVNVNLFHKNIIIGANNTGKTNFLRAIQLILDPKLSDFDRNLEETDFFDELTNPMENGEEIEIIIEIKSYDHIKDLVALLSDASISDNPPTLRLTYRYYPTKDDSGKILDYNYTIFQGVREDVIFSHTERKFFNIKIINALRDVEGDLRYIRKSPLYKLINEYNIDRDCLQKISEDMKHQSNALLSLDEIKHLENNINNIFSKLIGFEKDSILCIDTMDLDSNRLLGALKLLFGNKKRPLSEVSLGLNNLLFISLILLSLEDKTIPAFLTSTKYGELEENDKASILQKCYTKTPSGNYTLKDYLPDKLNNDLYTLMEDILGRREGYTILAIEEPEAHLHPVLQRIIYRDIMNRGTTSIILTTHSTHIASVSPLKSIVHFYKNENSSTEIKSTANISLTDTVKNDIERYLDNNRGEILFCKSIILVEGIAEEYLIKKFAELIYGHSLDEKGIIICNISSTNFAPYVKLFNCLNIPYVVITDGDYYITKDNDSSDTRIYHILKDDSHDNYGYKGIEIIEKLLTEINDNDIELNGLTFEKKKEILSEYSCFVGEYTLEVDILLACKTNQAKELIINVYNELTDQNKVKTKNFKTDFENNNFWGCLTKIINNFGKGRFAQRLSQYCIKEHIPQYVENALNNILGKIERG